MGFICEHDSFLALSGAGRGISDAAAAVREDGSLDGRLGADLAVIVRQARQLQAAPAPTTLRQTLDQAEATARVYSVGERVGRNERRQQVQAAVEWCTLALAGDDVRGSAVYALYATVLRPCGYPDLESGGDLALMAPWRQLTNTPS